MVILAAVLLFGWGALCGGFGAYALQAAFASESLFHVVQAGISLLIATVSISAGFLVTVVGMLRKSFSAHFLQPVPPIGAEENALRSEGGTAVDGQRE